MKILPLIIMAAFSSPSSPLSASDTMKELRSGNVEFETNKSMEYKRKQVKDKAAPKAIILTCADPRVCPNYIFSADIGEFFMVRNAGNILDESALGSIELALFSFNIPLIVVMGHLDCAMVKAAVSVKFSGSTPDTDPIGAMIKQIEPCLDGLVKKDVRPIKIDSKVYDEASKRNVLYQTDKLKTNPLIKKRLKEKSLKIVEAIYNPFSGVVEFINVD